MNWINYGGQGVGFSERGIIRTAGPDSMKILVKAIAIIPATLASRFTF